MAHQPIDPTLQAIIDNAGGNGSSGNTQLPGYLYPSRNITGVAKGMEAAVAADTVQSGTPTGVKKSFYKGSGLVDANGIVARGEYSPSQDTYPILLEIAKNPVALAAYNSMLKSHGFYGNSKPSALGYGPTDRGASDEFLMFANSKGRTWDVAFSMLSSMPPTQASGGTGGARVRVTNPADVISTFKKATSDLLGHELDDAENAKFAKLYRQMEMKGASTAEGAPSVSTVAENQIQKQFGAEAQSFKAGGMAQIMDGMIKGLGA